jgi:large subunit ribosomal protein L10e
MALRRAGAYSKKYTRPYTRRSSKKAKSYIKTVPNQKISNFKMGDINGFKTGKYKIIMHFVSGEQIQIRDNAIESSRQFVHKVIEENMPGNYYFEVKVYPHHILRETKVLTGAGADRMQTGMQHSFGVTMGRAALLKPNQEIFMIAVSSDKARSIVADALHKIRAKLPCHSRTLVEIRK